MDPHLFDLNAKLEGTHWWYLARSGIIQKLAERLVSSPARVLEVGCGTGGVLAALPKDWTRTGVDPSPKAIELGKSTYPELDLRLGVAPEDVRKELGSADLVLICDVLEHVEHDTRLFSDLVEGLPPGGQILLTVPAHPSLWTVHDVTHGHFRRYTRERLQTLWAGDKNLEVRLFSALNWYLYPLVKMVRLGSKLRGKTLGSGDSDLFLPPSFLNACFRKIFFSEHRALLARLDRSPQRRKLNGVSWIAVVRKPHSLSERSGNSAKSEMEREYR